MRVQQNFIHPLAAACKPNPPLFPIPPAAAIFNIWFKSLSLSCVDMASSCAHTFCSCQLSNHHLLISLHGLCTLNLYLCVQHYENPRFHFNYTVFGWAPCSRTSDWLSHKPVNLIQVPPAEAAAAVAGAQLLPHLWQWAQQAGPCCRSHPAR